MAQLTPPFWNVVIRKCRESGSIFALAVIPCSGLSMREIRTQTGFSFHTLPFGIPLPLEPNCTSTFRKPGIKA